jgi:hypothetical protein
MKILSPLAAVCFVLSSASHAQVLDIDQSREAITLICETTYVDLKNREQNADLKIELPNSIRFTNVEGYLKFYKAKLFSKKLSLETAIVDLPPMDPDQYNKDTEIMRSIRALYENDDRNTLFDYNDFRYGIKSDTRLFYKEDEAYILKIRDDKKIDIQFYVKMYPSEARKDQHLKKWNGSCLLPVVEKAEPK